MLQFSPDEGRQLRKALTDSFRSYSKLKIFVSDNFEDFRLDEIAESRATKIAADNLVECCEEEGIVEDLISALYRERPRNPEVQKLQQRLNDFFESRILLEPELSTSDELPFKLPSQYTQIDFESFLPQSISYEADVGKLKRGLQLASSVCRITFTDHPTTATGVVIDSGLVLTNYHVLSREALDGRSPLVEKARTLLCEFGWISDDTQIPIQPETFNLDPEEPVLAYSPPSALDYVLLKLETQAKKHHNLQPIKLSQPTTQISEKAALNLLQHPAGEKMQISLSASGIVGADRKRDRLWYVNRTQKGSSGAPCFDEEWECIALHHASVSRSFGSIREGILLSSILTEIQPILDRA